MARSGPHPRLGHHCSSSSSSSSSSNLRPPLPLWRRRAAAATAAAAADAAAAAAAHTPAAAAALTPSYDAARLLSGAAYTAPPLAAGPVAPDRNPGGRGLRLVATAPVRPGDLLLAARALAAVFGAASAVSGAAGAPGNGDLVELLAGRDYSPGELEWLGVVAAPPPRAARRGGAGQEDDGREDGGAEDDGAAASWQAARLERARRLFAAAAAGDGGSGATSAAVVAAAAAPTFPCPLSRDELEELVSRAALAEPSEDAAAAALRAADADAPSFGGGGGGGGGGNDASRPAVATAASAASVTALWPPFALANHSCAPTASVAVFGPVLVLRAAEAMLPGDEVTVCYLGEQRFAPVARRRDALRRSHGFLCQCRRCLAEQRVFPTRYYPQDDVLLGMADGADERGDDEGGESERGGGEQRQEDDAGADDATAAEASEGKRQPRLFFPRRSLPARALGWVAALATGRGAPAAARAWRGGRPAPPRPAPDHRCLEETWLLATSSLAGDVRAARTATVRAAGRREDAAGAADAARVRLDAGLEWAGKHAVPARRGRRRQLGAAGGNDDGGAEAQRRAGDDDDDDGGASASSYDDDDPDTAVPPEAAAWFAACGMPLHRADAELSRLVASAAVVMDAGDFFGGGDGGGDRDAADNGAPAAGERERLTPLEDDLRARRGLGALRAAQARRLAALGRCLSAAESVARGSELHCALAVEHASVARIVAARGGDGGGGRDGGGRERQKAAAAAAARALAADLRSARAHRERYGPPAECPPELIARLLAARRRAVAGAGLADRMGALAWGDAMARDRYAAAAASSGARLSGGGGGGAGGGAGASSLAGGDGGGGGGA